MRTTTYTINNNKFDFLRNNNKIIKRDKKIREIKLKGIHIFLIIITFALIATGIFYFGKFIMTWERLNIDKYILENSEGIAQHEIESILLRYKGNILGVNLSKMRKELISIVKVKDVSIKRILPSGIKIYFIKRKPVLRFEYKGKWNIIDDEGIILNRDKTTVKGLPIVRGVSKEEINTLIPYLNEINSIKDKVEYVSIKKPFGILLKLKYGNITVFPGVKDFRKKIGYFFKLKKKRILKFMKITSIDMRFDDRIYLEYEKEDILNG
jgi:cell division septal protein FtsQ